MDYKISDEITYPFTNFNACNFTDGHVNTYPCWKSKLIHVSKMGPWFICSLFATMKWARLLVVLYHCLEWNYKHTWRRHQMDIFAALLALCAGNSPVTGEFPAQKPVTRSFDIFFVCTWINVWVNNRKAGDLMRHRAHCDVIVMKIAMDLVLRWMIR